MRRVGGTLPFAVTGKTSIAFEFTSAKKISLLTTARPRGEVSVVAAPVIICSGFALPVAPTGNTSTIGFRSRETTISTVTRGIVGNVAVPACALSSATVHAPAPVQPPPDQPVNVEP